MGCGQRQAPRATGVRSPGDDEFRCRVGPWTRRWGVVVRGSACALARTLRRDDLPVNADFEAGYAMDTRELTRNVAAAVETGVAGISIKDFNHGIRYDVTEAAERIAAAKEAIRSSGADVLLVARAEGFIRGNPDLDDTIARLQAYSRAGADCLYAPGVKELSAIDQIVKAVAPKPLNVLMLGPAFTVAQLSAIGVRRVSVGGALAAAAWAAFREAAAMLRHQGAMPPRPAIRQAER